MTNRARPTWPDGAADNPQTQRPSQGGNKQSSSTAGSTGTARQPGEHGDPRPVV